MSKSKPIILSKEEHCRDCPVNLRCLAGSRLNYYDSKTERYNPLQAGACTYCQAVHFTVDGQRYICVNIRRGVHARKHPMYPVWDAETANMAEVYAMGAVADDDGGNQAPPQGQTCVSAWHSSDCASMVLESASTGDVTLAFKTFDSNST